MLLMLVGFRGSGKTSVGKRLANNLWYKFCDTDSIISQRQGKTIADFFKQFGEENFREVESNVLRECCALEDHIVALGGGAVIREQNRRMIKDCGAKVYYLKCDPAVLVKRLEADPKSTASRPPLPSLSGSSEEIKQALAQREAQYREVATDELEVTNLSIEEAAKYLGRML